MLDNNQQQFTLEMTVVSAQGLKNTSSFLFTHRLRPFITITTFPPPLEAADLKSCRGFQTRVDDQGGVNPTWGDKFHVPIHHTFFANRYSCIYLQLFTKRLISGKAQLESEDLTSGGTMGTGGDCADAMVKWQGLR
ncbi:hypothetical protein Golax_020153 [Gossypium laxum]|uniref:C2 domain-containing protein n=1 Tax=Gossypium laxum TaxID=34288 RepID=A0A7J8Z8Q8_9ROSI|nr:hypothetical protein [Gossypium laxum]